MGVCLSKRQEVKLTSFQQDVNIVSQVKEIRGKSKFSSSFINKIDMQHCDTEQKEVEEESSSSAQLRNILIIKDNIKLNNQEITNDNILKFKFYSKAKGFDQHSSYNKQLFLSNLYTLLNFNEEYFVIKKLIFIISLKAAAVDLIDSNEKIKAKQSNKSILSKMKYDSPSTLGNKLFKSKSLLTLNYLSKPGTILRLNQNEKRFCMNSLKLSDDEQSLNILPLLDDIEIIYFSEYELQEQINIINLIEENDVYSLFNAEYIVNEFNEQEIDNDHDCIVKINESSSNSTLIDKKSFILLKVYKERSNFHKNMSFIYKYYYRNILRPDKIIIVDNMNYLVYHKNATLLSKSNPSSNDKVTFIVRDLILFIEYTSQIIEYSDFGLLENSVLLCQSNEDSKETIYIHEFSQIKSKHISEPDFTQGVENDLYNIGCLGYKLLYGNIPSSSTL